jgi:hypothetical protein
VNRQQGNELRFAVFLQLQDLNNINLAVFRDRV